jgi:signal transduction histidine kinase
MSASMRRTIRTAAVAIALAVLAPSGAWWVVGGRAVDREAAALERQAWDQVRERADAVAARAARRLEAIRSAETARPWRHWSHRWVETDAACDCPAPRTSPLLRDDGLPDEVLGWFEVAGDGSVRILRARPELRDDVGAVGGTLAASLATTPEPDELLEPEAWTESPGGAVLSADTRLVAQGPFQWRSAAVAGVPRLAAVREIRTSEDVRVQGFVLNPRAPRQAAGPNGDRLVHGPREAPGEAELPLSDTVWRAVVDPTEELGRARAAAASVRLRFHVTFGLGAGAAAIAGLLGIVLLRQRERAVAARERWAAAAAHELRGPLAGLRLHGDILQDRLDRPADARDTLAIMTGELQRLERQVDNVIEYGRRGRGAPAPPLETEDVGELVAAVVAAARPCVREFGATLDLDVGTDLPPGCIHAPTLRQVLWNLIDNAARHGRSGRDGAHVRVVVRRDGPDLGVDVIDDGPGVPEDILRAALHARGPAPEPKPDGGLGIGLGLAASLTRAMRANLHHRRERDRTVFSLRIRSDPDLVLDTPD